MIVDIKIKNKKQDIEFTVKNTIKDVAKVYLDEYSNISNYLSPEESKHSHVFLADDIVISINANDSVYNINSGLIGEEAFLGLYMMTIIYDDGNIENKIIFDMNELYCVRMAYLKNSCNVCCDKSSVKMLTVLMFREMLFRNAINLDLIEDALLYYKDIYRPFCNKNNIKSYCYSGTCNI